MKRPQANQTRKGMKNTSYRPSAAPPESRLASVVEVEEGGITNRSECRNTRISVSECRGAKKKEKNFTGISIKECCRLSNVVEKIISERYGAGSEYHSAHAESFR